MNWEKKLKEMNVLTVGVFFFLFDGKSVFFKLFFHYSFPEEIFKIFSMEYSNFSFFFQL